MPRKPTLTPYPRPKSDDWPRIGTQRIFGRLLVLEFAGRDGYSQPYYLCYCECGQTRTVPARRLLEGRQKSCGCLRADPSVRRSARLKVTPELRREIALMGARELVEDGLTDTSYALAAKRQERDRLYASLWRRAVPLREQGYSWPVIAKILETNKWTLLRVRKAMVGADAS